MSKSVLRNSGEERWQAPITKAAPSDAQNVKEN